MKIPITSDREPREASDDAVRSAIWKREEAAAAIDAPIEVTRHGAIDSLRTAVAVLEREFAIELRERPLSWSAVGEILGMTAAGARFRATTPAPGDAAADEELLSLAREMLTTIAQSAGELTDEARLDAFHEAFAALSAAERDLIADLRERGYKWNQIGQVCGGVSHAVAIYRSLSPERIAARRERMAEQAKPRRFPAAPGKSIQEVADALGTTIYAVKKGMASAGIEPVVYLRGERKLIRVVAPLEEIQRAVAA